jgi:broad specificity phosphatase PhoE
MLEVRWYRHAESERNTSPHIIGGRSTLSPLSDNGKQQAHKLGRKFKSEGYFPDFVYSSPALRCKETARISMEEIGGEDLIEIHDGIQELDQGIAEGGVRAEFYNPETLKIINKDNHNFKFENGESQKEVEVRMLKALDDVKQRLEKNGKAKAIVFSHGMAMRCLLRGILDYPAKTNFYNMMNIHNAHGYELILDDKYHMWKLSRYNF